MPKYIRKDKVVLCQNGNEDNIIMVSILIESNHANSQLDQLLQILNSNVNNTVVGYKPKETQTKEKPQKKNKQFMDGVFV